MQLNHSIQAAMLIAGGFDITCSNTILGVKDTEKLLELAANGSLTEIIDFCDAINSGVETE